MSGCNDIVSNVALKDLKFTRQLAGAEDLRFGFGSVTQIRNGQVVMLSDINASVIPYDATNTIEDVIKKIVAKYPI